MKLEVGLLFFVCVVVPQVYSQLDPTTLISIMHPEMKLPPKPPRFLFPSYYQQQEKRRQQQREERRRKEMAVFRRLQAMSPEEIRKLQESLPRHVLQQLIQRLKYLKQQEAANRSAQYQGGMAGSGSMAGDNTITSGASRIRRPGSSMNSIGSGGPVSMIGANSTPAGPPPRRYNFMEQMQLYRDYQKKGRTAMTTAACLFPLGDPATSFVASFPHGCGRGAGNFCMTKHMACVEVKKAAMCCPPGFTSQTLEAINYMKQMQSFMAQFQ